MRRRKRSPLRAVSTLFALLLLLLLLGLVVLIGKAAFETPLSQPARAGVDGTPTSIPSAVSVVPFGRTAHTAGWDFAILGIDHPSTISGIGKLIRPQGIFTFVRLRITNRENESTDLHSWDFKLVDAHGRSYDMDTTDPTSSLFDLTYEAESQAQLLHYDSRIQPSLSLVTGLLFDVPPHDTGLHLQVQDGTLLALRA